MPKKIYIAGKVSGLPVAETSMKFGKYQKELMRVGHTPVVPLDLVDRDDNWETCMRKCISAMLTCDEVHFLNDWLYSPGARFEHDVAHRLGMTIVYCK
ncbi:MAG: DUF4406 domain-containing protein [Ginsengibacter sp.]